VDQNSVDEGAWEEPEPDRGDLRLCINCGNEYHDLDYVDSEYWEHPYSYFAGSDTHCLTCWLGCGPEVPIWRSAASEGCCFSAIIERVDGGGGGQVAVLLRAPYCAAVEAERGSMGYRLVDEAGGVVEGWECRSGAELVDGAAYTTQIGRAVLLLPPEAEAVVRVGQRVEFVDVPF
jgi:hypothetical protein